MSIRNRENRKRKARQRRAKPSPPKRPTLPNELNAVRALGFVAFPIFEQALESPRCCVQGSQIAERVLRDFGFNPKLRVADLQITNEAYRKRMGAFVTASPDPSVTVSPRDLDRWEEEGAFSVNLTDDKTYVDVVAEGGFHHHMILEVLPGMFLDPTFGQFKYRGFVDIPPSLVMLQRGEATCLGGRLEEVRGGVEVSYELRPDVRLPPNYFSPSIVEAEQALRQALAERGFKAAA